MYNPEYRYESMKAKAPGADAPTGLVLQWYLMCCYLYYKLNTSIVPDTLFDFWCELLYYDWDEFEHQHKHVISKEDLQAGTGYAIQYPLMVIHAAQALLNRGVELPALEKL